MEPFPVDGAHFLLELTCRHYAGADQPWHRVLIHVTAVRMIRRLGDMVVLTVDGVGLVEVMESYEDVLGMLQAIVVSSPRIRAAADRKG